MKVSSCSCVLEIRDRRKEGEKARKGARSWQRERSGDVNDGAQEEQSGGTNDVDSVVLVGKTNVVDPGRKRGQERSASKLRSKGRRRKDELHEFPPMVESLRRVHAVVPPLVLLHSLLQSLRLPLVLLLPSDLRVLDELVDRVLHRGNVEVDLQETVDDVVFRWGRR